MERLAYHKSIENARRQFEVVQLMAMADEAKEHGMQAIYKMNRPSKGGSVITNVEAFLNHCKNLYPSDREAHVPSLVHYCDQEIEPLVEEASIGEALESLNHLKSRSCSSIPVSPYNLKENAVSFAPILCDIANAILRSPSRLPAFFLEAVVVFLHKSGDRSNPNNYRSLVIQNPFLKSIMTLINRRVSAFAENYDLLPQFQFGFRKFRSTLGAASLLYEAIVPCLKKGSGKKVFVCFVDLRKAFDRVPRQQLFQHLLLNGFHPKMCELINNAFNGLKNRIKLSNT